MKFLGSKTFFYLTIMLLALQALWIALTARYPQAFDEQVHFGLIQLHAHSWLPFFTSQPAGADAYGAVVRDPSYLYHYLLSFPYRVLAQLTSNEVVQIIVLRLLNIALLCCSLPIFSRILRRIGLSAGLTNLVLLLFVLTPVMPLLASQINYDNLMVPLAGLLILLCLRLQQTIRASRPTSLTLFGAILTLGCLASLVKYPFLPIAAVAIVYAGWQLLRHRTGLATVKANAKTIALLLLCLLSVGLFAERYAVNIVRYHTPTPECDQVISEKRCEAYSPWLRNRQFAQQFDSPNARQVVGYPASWLGRVIEESLFSIGSGFNNGADVTKNNFGTVDYWQGRSLLLPRLLTIATLCLGVLAFLAQARSLLNRPALRLSLVFTAVYTAVLFLLNASDFLHIGVITAVHGRYLLPILPIFIGIMALAVQSVLKRVDWLSSIPRYQAAIVTMLVVVFWAQGGGIVTYIVRSQPRWFWPQSAPAQALNAGAQRLLKPVVIGSNKY